MEFTVAVESVEVFCGSCDADCGLKSVVVDIADFDSETRETRLTTDGDDSFAVLPLDLDVIR